MGKYKNTAEKYHTLAHTYTQIIMCKQKEEKSWNIASSVCEDIRLCETAECLIYEADQESSH